MTKKHERLAIRLVDILVRLNAGERLNVQNLAEEYKVSVRTIQRDFNERLALLDYDEQCGANHYKLKKTKQGCLTKEEIQRIANFASIQDLFPEVDRKFFQEKLSNSILIKGFQYENIQHKKNEFNCITNAITNRHYLNFDYQKINSTEQKSYRIQPYHLVNKNGIWYLVGLDEQQKQKTFCFNQIQNLTAEEQTFEFDEALQNSIRSTDSIYYGNQINEIVIKINAQAAGYFQRRPLLPNQETLKKLEDGGLLLMCKDVNAMEVVPIIQYWIPHATIISPIKLQQQMEEVLRKYLKI